MNQLIIIKNNNERIKVNLKFNFVAIIVDELVMTSNSKNVCSLSARDANPLQNSGWFGLWVSKICYFGFRFGFRVFKNPILGLGSGSGFENFPKNRVLGSGLGWVL